MWACVCIRAAGGDTVEAVLEELSSGWSLLPQKGAGPKIESKWRCEFVRPSSSPGQPKRRSSRAESSRSRRCSQIVSASTAAAAAAELFDSIIIMLEKQRVLSWLAG